MRTPRYKAIPKHLFQQPSGKARRPRGDDDEYYWEPTLMPDLTVFEEDNEPVFIGIFDAEGNPLFWYTEKFPIGFDLSTPNDEDDYE